MLSQQKIEEVCHHLRIRHQGALIPKHLQISLVDPIRGDLPIMDNRKVKEELGGKGQTMPASEASEITGHSVGAITPLCLGSLLPIFFDIGLKRFEEVVTAGGSTHAAIRIPPDRFAQLVDAKWVDVCKDT